MELGLSTYSIAQHVKCDLARPWVRGALKKKPHTGIRGKRRKKRLRRENTSFSRCELTIKTAFLVIITGISGKWRKRGLRREKT